MEWLQELYQRASMASTGEQILFWAVAATTVVALPLTAYNLAKWIRGAWRPKEPTEMDNFVSALVKGVATDKRWVSTSKDRIHIPDLSKPENPGHSEVAIYTPGGYTHVCVYQGDSKNETTLRDRHAKVVRAVVDKFRERLRADDRDKITEVLDPKPVVCQVCGGRKEA